MASEVIKQVWCDLHLNKMHVASKVPADEGFAHALHDDQHYALDACSECQDGLLYSDVLAFGYLVESLSKPKPYKPSPTGKRPYRDREKVRCSVCGKTLTNGAGWSLHNKFHREKEGVKDAVPLPLP